MLKLPESQIELAMADGVEPTDKKKVDFKNLSVIEKRVFEMVLKDGKPNIRHPLYGLYMKMVKERIQKRK